MVPPKNAFLSLRLPIFGSSYYQCFYTFGIAPIMTIIIINNHSHNNFLKGEFLINGFNGDNEFVNMSYFQNSAINNNGIMKSYLEICSTVSPKKYLSLQIAGTTFIFCKVCSILVDCCWFGQNRIQHASFWMNPNNSISKMAAFYLLCDIHFGKCFLWQKFLSKKRFSNSSACHISK